jgi:hypothetical protein
LTAANRLQLSRELRDAADEVRALDGVVHLPAARREALAARCEAIWAKRDVLLEALRGGPAGQESAAAADLQEIARFAEATRRPPR